jgi:two-component system, OmpR family, sensor kinase
VRTIRQQLLIWLVGGMLACTVSAGVAVYFVVDHEADQLFDYQLQELVQFWTSHLPAETAYLGKDKIEEQENLVVQVWDSSNKLIFASRPAAPMPQSAVSGFSTLSVGNERWRFYTRNRHGFFVQAAQPVSVRQKIAANILVRALVPIVALIPILGGLIWLVVGRNLQPLRQAAEAIRRRFPGSLQPLPVAGIPPDIRTMIDAINDLLRRLDAAMSSQRAFIADAAHELRTPLTALRLQLQLVQRAASDEKRAVALDNLEQGLNRATYLVQQLLALAQSEHPAVEGEMVPVDLCVLAREVVADRAAIAETRRIDLGATSTDREILVRGRPDDLRTLLGNLVDNALLYSGSNGHVDVSALFLNGGPALRVADTGPGIPAVDRQRVFERFYRRDDTGQSGTGLGLAIVKNIAERHDATVRLSDGPNGKGLEATVLFRVTGPGEVSRLLH